MSIETNILSNIFLQPFYVVDRICTASWKLGNQMNHYNLMFIYEGEAIFERNGEIFKAGKGDFIFYMPGDIRKAHTFSDRLMKCFAVDFTYTCLVLENNEWKTIKCDLPFNIVENIHDPYLYARLVELFSALSRMWLSKKKDNLMKIRIVFTEIMSLMFQYKECNHYTYSDTKRAEQIMSYITEHYSEKITLKNLSENMQLSYSYLGNIFKRVTGKPIIEYLIRVRLNKAKELLKDRYSVSDAANMTGFNDIFYFSKVFKKYEGLTPSQYRRDNINN